MSLGCYPDVVQDCCATHKALDNFRRSFLEFEVDFLNELDILGPLFVNEVDWSPGFFQSCFIVFQVFFEHFALSSTPCVIDFYPN